MPRPVGLLLLVLTAVPVAAPAAEPGTPTVIENVVLDHTLQLEGPRWNGAIVRNVTVQGVDGDGIVVRNVRNLRIENCTIANVAGRGIKLSVTGSTRDVHIVGNRITNTGLDGISAGQRHARGIDHPGLVVRGNQIARTGLLGTKGLNHGIYVQSTDFLIEGNSVSDSFDGNGISVRSSGVVRDNVVSRSGKSGIAYYADHMSGPSDQLVIEGNRVSESGRRQPRSDIDLLRVPEPSMAVRSIALNGNDVTSIAISTDYESLGIRLSLTGNRCAGHLPCPPALTGG